MAGLGRQHLLHFVDEVAQVDRLGQHLGVLGCCGVGVERDRGEARDEHDLDVGIEFGARRASSMLSRQFCSSFVDQLLLLSCTRQHAA